MHQAETIAEPAKLSNAGKVFLALVLAGLTFLAFGSLLSNSYEFINLDDADYVTRNPHVREGPTPANVRWAFSAVRFQQWMPFTWISLQIDAVLFGLQPAGYHLTNVLLHAAAALLLAGTLYRMTGAVGRSFVVAVFFALHPLRVESVAWIAERKDVLSGLFWMLSLAAYAWYAERPCLRRYLLVLLAFVAGNLSKPIVVTLPFVLLLLDYWPLQRFRRPAAALAAEANGLPKAVPASLGRLVAEKLPLLAISLLACLWALHAQQGMVMSLEEYPPRVRLSNALISYIRYLFLMLWPTELALGYPHRGEALSSWAAAASAILLASITLSVLYAARKRRYLAVGWFWYLGTLVPVIGVVQLTAQAMADRYSYLPSVGILLLVVWGMTELAEQYRCERALEMATVVLVIGCGLLTWVQVHWWQNSRMLWEHTLSVTGNPNPMAHNLLGAAWLDEGRSDWAENEFHEALRETPQFADAHYNLGLVRLRQRNTVEAVRCFAEALRFDPDHRLALHALGVVLQREGKHEQARLCFEREAALAPR